jgi:hypothetical protein
MLSNTVVAYVFNTKDIPALTPTSLSFSLLDPISTLPWIKFDTNTSTFSVFSFDNSDRGTYTVILV